MGQGVWTMKKTIGSRLDPNQQAKTQERKITRQKGCNSTWHDEDGLGLGTQTWHGVHKHMEDGIKTVKSIDPSTQAYGNIDLHIQAQKHVSKHVESQYVDVVELEFKRIDMYGCRSKHETWRKAHKHIDPSKEQPTTSNKHVNM